MAKHVTYTCDRCKAKSTGGVRLDFSRHAFSDMGHRFNITQWQDPTGYDLCDHCGGEFLEFIRTGGGS